ncbi:signal transduction histidine kinase [Candidatus Scalindua japonica]|uniref:histidine kinase n=1 Tax=Candidatus Scalindua japonica TaxID=1284222 RepID=A0A286TW34_9BACT|nr:ATP-binding protein [Candidatus Scalindua japonica]GAX60054.1 signal transduction histidine kinase [Candidatus Scalindua japonica]
MKNLSSYKSKIKQLNSVKELLTIFDSFNTYAQKLESSYKQLQERVKKIDREMAYTNECLNKKVLELDNQTRFLNSILGSMHSGVIAVDNDGIIMTFNNVAESTLNVVAEDVLGKDIRSALSHIGGFVDLLLESMSKNEKIDNLKRIIEIDNDVTRNIESSISILKDDRGVITGFVEIFHDLSEICELKGRLNSASDLVSVGTMAASIAHEIRNPLNGIEGFASLLERELEGDSLRLIKHIIKGTKNINKIVTDLLFLARPIKLNLRKDELPNIIDKALLFVDQELGYKGCRNIQIEKDYENFDDFIYCDSDRLQQAFLNILLNAIQSMPEGGKIKIFTRKSTAKDIPVMQVGFVDTGDGINNGTIKKIFEPFFTTKDDGTGLGLAIVRKIIELHDGRINIFSGPEKGTTIMVNLPGNHNDLLSISSETNYLSSNVFV